MIILDTQVLSELMRPEPAPSVVRWMSAQPLSALHVTAFSCAEILLGISLLPDGARRQQLTEQAEGLFAEEFAGRILGFEPAAAPAYAALAAPRRQGDKLLRPVDGMIAAIAHIHGAAIATRSGDFDGCGVPLIDPWAAS